MQGNQVELLRLGCPNCGASLEHPGMANPMKPESTDAMPLREGAGNRIIACLRGKVAVKSRISDDHRGNLWQPCADRLNRRDGRGIMQRRKFRCAAERAHDRFRRKCGLGYMLAAVHD